MSTIVAATARLITAHRVMDKLKISRSAFYRMLAQSEFPKPTSINGQPRWSEQMVDQWLFAHKRHPITRQRGAR